MLLSESQINQIKMYWQTSTDSEDWNSFQIVSEDYRRQEVDKK